MKTKNLTSSSFDLVFLGMGAANSLLFLELSRTQQLDLKKIAIIEPDSKNSNDRTFCFWATETEIQEFHLTELISKSWDFATAGSQKHENISPLKYHHISAISLYNKVKEEIKKYPVTYFHEFVEDENIKIDEKQVHVTLADFKLETDFFFDSRPPKFKKCTNNQTSLVQSFFGWNIKTEQSTFDSNEFVMMDFDLDQMGSTQFLYVLPFTENQALVELTAFQKNPLEKKDTEHLLHSEILKRFGEFQIIATESGNIPMCTAQIELPTEKFNPYFATGAKAGNIKPSTGYSFLTSCKQAQKISNDISSETSEKNKHTPYKTRFQFYDRLLLNILNQNPSAGKPIFERLFQRNSVKEVIYFLKEETQGWNEIKLLCSLPILPFLWAAIKDVFACLPWVKLMPFVLGSCFLGFDYLNATFIVWALLLFGLFLVGIPHGAIDHLLESNHFDAPIKVGFILNYLLKMAVMALIWWVNPVSALILFLLYSAWHFGESEYQVANIWSFLWGCFMLTSLLYSHPLEFKETLSNMSVNVSISNAFEIWIGSFTVLIIIQLKRGFHRIWEILWLPLFSQLPLLQAFGLFFVFNHSINSSIHLMDGFSKKAIELFKKALPFTLAAFLFLGGFYFFRTWFSAEGWIAAFFIFISCISFPHVFAMHRFYRSHFFLPKK